MSDVLSKPPTMEFKQVEGFIGEKALTTGRQREIKNCTVLLNYYCKICTDVRTFKSKSSVYCIGVDEHMISIDCVLTCHCGASVQIWFLVDSEVGTEENPMHIHDRAPAIRILKRSEKMSADVLIDRERYGDFSILLEKAQRAHRDGLGAGSIVYLRKIFEQITTEMAKTVGISSLNQKNKRKPFKKLLEEVDLQCSIIPSEFSANGYRLFGDLSNIVHGEYDEELALSKYDSLHRLIVGILDNVRNSDELKHAIGALGWNKGGVI